MHLVCDFDNTLFDTTTHWNAWLNVLVSAGIDREEAIAKVEAVIIQGFTLHAHAERVGLGGKELERAVKQFEVFTNEHAPSFVYQDVVPYFDKHKPVHTFSLLTYGDSDYQHFKVHAANLQGYFESIRIAGPHKLKVSHLSEMLKRTDLPLAFVDDSPNELEPVYRAGLPVKLFRISRPEGRHTDRSHELDGVAWTCIQSIDEISL